MEFKFRIFWTTLVVSLSVLSLISEGNQYNESSGFGGVGYNQSFDNNSDSNGGNNLKRSNNPEYDHSLYYEQYRSPAYGHYLKVMYGNSNYNYHQPNYQTYQRPSYNKTYQQLNYTGYNHGYGNYSKVSLQSPYQTLPGSYKNNAYNHQLYSAGKMYSPQSVYGQYLASGAYQYQSAKCANHYGQTPQISSTDMESAFSYAHQQLRSYDQTYGNYSGYSNKAPVLKLKEKEAILMEYVSEFFAKYKCLSKYQTTTYLPSVKVGQQYTSNNKYGDTSCYSNYGLKGWKLECPDYNSKYRSIDGSCNNRNHPYWGKSYVCHIRLLPPDYSDGIQSPRLSSYGTPLPSARTLSNIVAADLPFDSYYVHLKMAFGQFVNHDITNTPTHGSYSHTSDYSGPLDCCKDRHNKQCFPIDIYPSPYDYQYKNYKNTCLNFVRSAPCPLCEIGPRQQINIATSYVDASAIYGSSVNNSIALRTLNYGLLKTSQDIYGKPILMASSHPYQNQCNPPTSNMKCFTTGDPRVNQHPQLMVMHTLFVRSHNAHATALRYVNPHWSDEVLYQEARRIVIAEFQHITYKEYLPVIFGPTLMNYYSLNVGSYGYTNYEPYTDPTTWNDYAAAACRFGHSQIRGLQSVLTGYDNHYNTSDSFWLRDRFFDPSYLWLGKLDGLVKGLTVDSSKSVDPYFVIDITNYLFRKRGEKHGSDLVATNIQRGRDHGIPGYVNYLKYCFNYDVYSWDDLNRFIPANVVNLLKQLYKSWKDIDFYIGGISERHFPDGDVGPTFACVLGIQYYHLKFGDRFYFEHGGQSGSFSPAQLDNIRKTTTLARFLCRSSDYMDGVQRYAFFPQSNYNPKLSCKSYPEINYNLWKDGY